MEYSTISDLLGSAVDGAELRTDDGKQAYHMVPLAPETRKYFGIQCPVTGETYVLTSMPFGLKPACALFALPMAVMRDAIGSSVPSRGGWAHVVGMQDDTAQATAQEKKEEHTCPVGYVVTTSALARARTPPPYPLTRPPPL